MKNHFERVGEGLSARVYEAPSMSLQTFSSEAGFAASGNNGIDDMQNWGDWEEIE